MHTPIPLVPRRARRGAGPAQHALLALRGLLALVLLVLGACSDAPTTPAAPAASRTPDAGPRAYLVAGPSYTQLSAGRYHGCAVRSDGSITCWGSGSEATPPSGTDFTLVSAGYDHSCALRRDGAITCWGGNTFRQATPPPGTDFTQVSAGGYSTCALRTDGSVVCWGINDIALATPAGTGFTQVSTGNATGCALRNDGAIACWGTSQATASPAGVGYTRIAIGDRHGCALTAAGAIVCWGSNEADKATPPPGTGYTQVGGGLSHSCALTAEGAIVCWGNTSSPTVSDAPTGTGFTELSVGSLNSCARTAAGAIVCWGRGIGTPPDVPAPTRVLPTAVFTAPTTVVAGQSILLTLAGAQVPGYPQATAFTYAFDCGDDRGYVPAAAASVNCPTTAAGTRTVRGKVIDQDGDAGSYAATVDVVRAAQAITFTSTPPRPAVVGGTYTVAATGGASGNPVAFSTLTPTTCAVAGSTVTLLTAGACTVAADQAGTAAYDAAPRQTQTFTVAAPVPPALAFPRTAVLDRFARADGVLGDGWGGFSAPVFFRVQGQQGAVALGGGIGWAAAAFGPTQEAFVTLASLGSGTSAGGAQGLVLKGQDPRDYTLGALTVAYDPKAGAVRVSALRVRPTAATGYPAVSARYAAGDQLGARATAAGAVEVYRNGTLVGAVTLTAADKAYFSPRGGYVGLLYVAAPGARFDDFGGGAVTP